jgi:hypothetical protein
MPVLIILAGKALGMILACDDWALLRPLALVSQHVCLQVLEDLSAVWIIASSLVVRLVTAIRALLAVVRLM